MKKIFCILPVLLLLISSFTARASHLMGGDITAVWFGSGPNDLTYKVTLSLYRDINGIPFTNPETINVAFLGFPYSTLSPLTVDTTGNFNIALVPFFPYGVEVGIYTGYLTLPYPGKYELSYYSCCRNAAIVNAANPNSHGMVLHTEINTMLNSNNTICNSSPECMVMPIAYFPINTSATYNPLPYDVNGDSLSWSLVNPIDSSYYTTSQIFVDIPGFTTPSAASSGPFTMNSVTGEITWTPNALGNYIQSFKINEYRSGMNIGGIIRDMQYIIVTDTAADSLSLIATSPCNVNPNPNYNYVYYVPGQTLNFNVLGACGNNSIPLTLNALGSIFNGINPATFTSTGTNSSVPGTLHWTPPTGFSKDVIVVFRLKGGMFSKDYTLLLRKNSNPNNIINATEQESMVSVYPNPVRNNLNVSIDLAKNMNGDISLYSVLGQKVATIYNGKLEKGSHNLNKNIDVAAGMYYLVVRDNGVVINTKHIVVQ